MVGVCLTSISLVKIIEGRIGQSHVDEYLAITRIIFLVSTFLAYLVLRARLKAATLAIIETLADWTFLFGLAVMVIVATLFAYETI